MDGVWSTHTRRGSCIFAPWEANFAIFADGGKRGTGETSSACVMYALVGEFLKLIAYRTFYGRDDNSFIAEVRSIYMASTLALEVLPSRCPDGARSNTVNQ